MIGTLAMSGSVCTRFRKRVIISTPSIIPSSKQISMTLAPFWTCWRATSTASSSAACIRWSVSVLRSGVSQNSTKTSPAPAIASRAASMSSIPEVVGDAALLFDPCNPADIAVQLDRLLHDAALCADLVARGRVQAQRFSWDDAASGVLQQCHEAVAA